MNLPNACQSLQAHNELEEANESRRELHDKFQKLAESLAANEEEHQKVCSCCTSAHQRMKLFQFVQELYMIRQQWQNELREKSAAYEEMMKRQQQEMSKGVAEVCRQGISFLFPLTLFTLPPKTSGYNKDEKRGREVAYYGHKSSN